MKKRLLKFFRVTPQYQIIFENNKKIQKMKKGTNNPNGRPKGVPNRVTGELRTRIANFLDAKFETVIEDFERLEAKERVVLFTKLIEYVLPKMRTIEDTTVSQLYEMTPEQREQRILELEKQLIQ